MYLTHFRPVPLREYAKIGSHVHDTNLKIVRTLPPAQQKDPDHVNSLPSACITLRRLTGQLIFTQVVMLCAEVVASGHSVLVFCPTRKACEQTCKHIAEVLPSVQVFFFFFAFALLFSK